MGIHRAIYHIKLTIAVVFKCICNCM
jgi:hypothetical protein